MSDLAATLSHQNREAGQPDETVIRPEFFLKHLEPDSGDSLAWQRTYYELRAKYKEGSI